MVSSAGRLIHHLARMPREPRGARKTILALVLAAPLFSCGTSSSESTRVPAAPATSTAASGGSASAPKKTPTTSGSASAANQAGANDWSSYARHLKLPDMVDRLQEASRLLLGATYSNGPLGEGDRGGPDPDPRVDFTKVDCVTYLEESLALALSARRNEAAFLEILDKIRYANGEVGFRTRNHYMMRDWVPANSWLVDDVTREVGGSAVRSIKKTIDRSKFLRDQGVAPGPADEPSTIEFAAIPLSEVTAVGSQLRSGDLVFWVAKKPGIDIAHTGMIVRDPRDGSLVHRHASSKGGKAMEEPLAAYAGRATFAEGFVVVRMKPEPEIPGIPSEE